MTTEHGLLNLLDENDTLITTLKQCVAGGSAVTEEKTVGDETMKIMIRFRANLSNVLNWCVKCHRTQNIGHTVI